MSRKTHEKSRLSPDIFSHELSLSTAFLCSVKASASIALILTEVSSSRNVNKSYLNHDLDDKGLRLEALDREGSD